MGCGMYYIGVDLGTSSVKLILMEPTGDIVNTVSKTYPISFPKPGWSEQNPTDWYDVNYVSNFTDVDRIWCCLQELFCDCNGTSPFS